MLLGRAGEIGRIEELLEQAARQRTSAALIVHGEPGVGKTSLLDHVAGAAEGFAILRVQPLEAEAELPFAGLFDLVRPIQHLLDRIPEPQRAALAGALAVGPPAPGDRFAVAAATLSLLGAAADEQPVLAIVDDAHWLDAASRGALLFAGRRLAGEGVVLLLGMRDREWTHAAGLPTLTLAGLAPQAAQALVDRTAAVAPAVRERVIAETEGNPLAILETLKHLSPSQLRGDAAISQPLAAGAALERTFAERLATLPDATRHGLLVAAASDTGDRTEIERALSSLEPLEPAERAGLIIVNDGHISFRHPLIRSAAYHVSDPVARRAAHQAYATALDDETRAAWHLAASTAGPDEAVAAGLEDSAARALARSAYAAAAQAFETAARLSPDPQARLRRTLGAGRALWLSGEPERAAALLDGVLELATDPLDRADLQQLRCDATLDVRPIPESYSELVDEAARVLEHDPARAAAFFEAASLVSVPGGDFERAAVCAHHAIDTGAEGLLGPLVLAMLAGLRGERRALDLIEPRLEALFAADPLGKLTVISAAVTQTLGYFDRHQPADRLLTRVIASARGAGALVALPYPLTVLADLELRRGALSSAYATATEAVQLAEQTGQRIDCAIALVVLARVEAVLGHELDCRTHTTAALELSQRTGMKGIDVMSSAALGVLDLGRGRADRAAPLLDESARGARAIGVMLPTMLQSAADRVEAHVRAGSAEAAAEALADLEAHRFGLRWPSAVAARCRGLIDDDFEPAFATALELHGDSMAFEKARTQLCLGMRRRRAGRRADARAVLLEALEYFEAAGAEPWAAQTRAELQASGVVQARSGGSLRELTPQELQVALVVTKGATNREAAAALFLSEKTVEFHLSNTYRKLGLRSRAELVRRVEGLP